MISLSRRTSAGLLISFILIGGAISIFTIRSHPITSPPTLVGIIFPLLYAIVVLAYLRRYYFHPHSDTLLTTAVAGGLLLTGVFLVSTAAVIWGQEVQGGEIVDEGILMIEMGLGGSIVGLAVGHLYGESKVARRKLHRTNEELESQVQRLDEFTSIVSHDLRNPLTVAEGHLQLAQEEADSQYLEAAERALDRMGTMIEELLALAREGKHIDVIEEVDLAETMHDSWESLDTADASIAVETSHMIRADRARLRQLLENLVHNAVKHGDEAVTVTIDDLDDGFYVADDGGGIPPDIRESVFEQGVSGADDGTGFGLTIVEQIVDAHDWEIQVTESDSGGARFDIKQVEIVG